MTIFSLLAVGVLFIMVTIVAYPFVAYMNDGKVTPKDMLTFWICMFIGVASLDAVLSIVPSIFRRLIQI